MNPNDDQFRKALSDLANALQTAAPLATRQRLAERKGARIVSAAGEGTDTSDPTSRLMRQIVDFFAEYERAIIRGRRRFCHASNKKRLS